MSRSAARATPCCCSTAMAPPSTPSPCWPAGSRPAAAEWWRWTSAASAGHLRFRRRSTSRGLSTMPPPSWRGSTSETRSWSVTPWAAASRSGSWSTARTSSLNTWRGWSSSTAQPGDRRISCSRERRPPRSTGPSSSDSAATLATGSRWLGTTSAPSPVEVTWWPPAPLASRAPSGDGAASPADCSASTSPTLLPAIRLPVLALAGSADRVVPPGESAQVADLIPGARLQVFEGAGHMLPMERSAEVGDLILRLAKDVDGREAADRSDGRPAAAGSAHRS